MKMPSRIEDYALIGDCHTAALVGRDGSIDWLSFPRFDSGACFAALLGTRDHGRWLLAPAGGVRAARRRYRPGSLVLETEFETDTGLVCVTDFMPVRDQRADLVRIVEGKRGGGDHLTARTARRRAQLGLPLLLAARRHVYPPGPHERRLRRGGERLADLAVAGGGRPPGRAADHVRPGRRAPADRVRAALAA